MNATIISIGNELLNGRTVNTNASWMAIELRKIGFHVSSILTVGDKEEDIKQYLRIALQEADAVFLTGGLGPTHDDVTKEAIADFMGSELELNEELLEDIRKRFERHETKMPQSNIKQALIPKGVTLIENPIGTAAGFYFIRDDSFCFVLPGVPAEMKIMMKRSVLPILKDKFASVLPHISSRTIRTTGVFESKLYEQISPLQANWNNVEVAYLPHLFGVDMVLSAVKESDNDLDRYLDQITQEVISRLGSFVYEVGTRTLEQIIAELLIEKKLSMAVAESCTGGLISNLVTNIPGSSQFFLGGTVAYSNKVKEQLLRVSTKTLEKFGAVSEQTAREMVLGVQEVFGADCAISVTGIAGPTGGTAEKPVGLVFIGTAVGEKVGTSKYIFHKQRDLNKHRFAYAALNQLRLQLLE